MKFEQPIKYKKTEDNPQKLEDALPFIRPTKQEIEWNNKFRKATNLELAGRMEESSAIIKSLGKEPERDNFTKEEEEMLRNARSKIAEQLGYKVIANKGRYFALNKDGYHIRMQNFEIPYRYGYNDGRITMIEISKGEICSLWHNGWEKKSKDESINKIFNEIVNYFN